MGCGGSKADPEEGISPKQPAETSPQPSTGRKAPIGKNVNNSNNPDGSSKSGQGTESGVPDSKAESKESSGSNHPLSSTSEANSQSQATNEVTNQQVPMSKKSTETSKPDAQTTRQLSATQQESQHSETKETETPKTTKPLAKTDSTTDSQEKIAVSKTTKPPETTKPPVKKDSTTDSQEKFAVSLRMACELVDPEDILQQASAGVIHSLQLQRALPPSISLFSLVRKLQHLQVLDVSNNLMGPQAFRCLLLALCKNTTITTLNISNNQTDTDSAECVGKLLKENRCLVCLDVSGNYLGKDYFSRCVAPAIASNTALEILRCESIGSTDMTAVTQSLQDNSTLTELNLSHNELPDSIPAISAWLQKPSCHLKSLEIKNAGLRGDAVKQLTVALSSNSSLRHLNISSNQVSSMSQMMEFLVCCCHSNLTSLVADDLKPSTKDTWKPAANITKHVSKLCSLSLSNCCLTNDLMKALLGCLGDGCLAELVGLNLANNPELTGVALESLVSTMSVPCKLQKLSYGLNTAEELPSHLGPSCFPNLQYLNLRKAKISPAAIGQLAASVGAGGIETLVLDGIKLAGSDALAKLLVNPADCSLVALSLSGCQLTDKDLRPLWSAIAGGMLLHMLKLSTNRLTDNGVSDLVEALLGQVTHPLALIDCMNNKIGNKGAEKICGLFASANHTSKMHSVNLNNNCIGCDGASSLMKVVGKFPGLTSLQLSNQQTPYEEEDMQQVLTQIANTLGLKVTEEGGQILAGCSTLPAIPSGLSIKLLGLGGQAGELGKMLDSVAIATDFQKQRLPYLSLQHILELASALQGSDCPQCLMSSAEWRKITDADKEAPSWLQVAEHRSLAVYMSHLPASVSTQKMEAVLEMEADCAVQEVFLCKDMVTRKNNGLAWVLLSDTESVDKALQLMHLGEAKVFGQSFLISRLNVTIDDEASIKAEAQARKDMERRQTSRQREDTAHRSLIQQSYQESQARHAYRLAHPAYADGRIW